MFAYEIVEMSFSYRKIRSETYIIRNSITREYILFAYSKQLPVSLGFYAKQQFGI